MTAPIRSALELTVGKPVLSAVQREAVRFTSALGAFVLMGAAALGVIGIERMGGIGGVGGAVGIGSVGHFGLIGCSVSIAVFLSGSLLVVRALNDELSRYGAANRLTQIRLAMAALLCGLALQSLADSIVQSITQSIAQIAAPTTLSDTWFVLGLATVAAALDALDGPLARRQELANALGARFDMEVDAFFLLVLSLLAWQCDKLGPWIVLAGAMRYVFVAAAWLWPRLNAPLPPSRRRQTACVIQIVGLLVALLPGLGSPSTTLAAGFGLAVLAGSFAIDIVWLARNRS